MASHPAKIGKYNIEGIIGRGGMGVVYKAVDSQIGRYVAIKMITSGGDPSLLERFKSEARSTGSLQCPNIVTVYDFGEQDGNPYLVMQFLEGSSLDTLIQKGAPLTLSERLGIIIDVCNGLAYAHQRGVIHRDIKPANIMVLQDGVNDGMAMIVDFGIARIGGDARLTKTDQIIGSVHYMSVEQLQAKELDNRTDIYATGVVLFQLLTGALPFEAPETAATLLKIVNEPPPPLSAYLKEYPAELEAIVSRALAKKREERYASAKDLAFDLMQVQERLKSETVVQLIRRAEASLGREEWTRAREQLQQVLRIDRQNTQAQKMINAVQERLRQQQQIEQARALRSQADEAYMDQRFDDALRLLDQAVVLDPKNSDLQSLRESVRLSKERATGLRRALRRAEAALQDGDLDEAQSAVSEAFKIDPQDTQAKALKVIISQHAEERLRQEQLEKLLDQARNQIAARDLTEAFATLKAAEALDPTSNELQSVARMAVSAREQERRRAETEELRRQIEAALVHEDYATAVAKADEGLRKFPQEQSLLKLKALAEAQRVRVEQKRFVREQFATASSLADAGQLAEALAVLDRAVQRAPGNSELEALRSTLRDRVAAEEWEQQRLQAIDATLVEGRQILQERGAGSAKEFLDVHAVQYLEFPQVREFYDAVCTRAALDALDSRLASEPNPAKRVQLAEEAARSNPDNHWIRQRLADLQQVRAQISAAIERARGLEAEGRFSDATREWQLLRKAYPEVPEFEAQIRRLASLEAESKKVKTVPAAAVPPVAPEPPKVGKPTASLSATRVIDSAVLPEVAPTKVTPTKIEPAVARAEVAPPPRKVAPPPREAPPPRKPVGPGPRKQLENLLAGSNRYIVIAAAAVVLVVVGYLIFGGGKTVTVRITSDPANAEVVVGDKKCRAPCDLKLKPGTYQLHAVHDGYLSLTQEVSIAADTKSLPVTMVPVAPPAPPGRGTLAVRTNVDGVEVFVEGTSNGVTGRDKKLTVELNEGSYEISVKKDGYDQLPAERIDIPKDGNVPLTFNLTKTTAAQGFLVITSKPGADVIIDHRFFGRVSANGSFSVQVKPTTHLVELQLKGYESWSANRSVKSDEHLPINAELKPIPTPTVPSTPLPSAPVVSFRASTETIQPGQPVTLSWETQNANEVSIDQRIGSVDKNSSRQVNPTTTTTYTLTAKGPGGSITRSVAINVAAPPPAKPVSIDVFEAGSETIQQGGTTSLIWGTQNATEVSIDPGLGPVKGTKISVRPSQTTTYTLTAKGPGGDVQKRSVTVTVVAEKAVTPIAPGGSSEAKQCIDRYQAAYQLKSIDQMTKAWPSLDSKRKNAMKDVFKGPQAIILQYHCAEPPSRSGDTVHYQCAETMQYSINGNPQKPETHTFEFVCRQTSSGWVVENRVLLK